MTHYRKAMNLQYEAAVLHAARTPLVIERVSAAPLGDADVLVRTCGPPGSATPISK